MTQQAISLDNILAAFDPTTPGPDGVTLKSQLDWLNLTLAFLATPQFGSFPITSWGTGEVANALVGNNAYTMSAMNPTVYNAICGGLLDLAVGPWLDLWAWSLYKKLRTPAVQQVQTEWFNVTGSLNLNSGDLIIGTKTGSPSYTTVIEDPNNSGSYIATGISIPTAGQDGTYQPSGLPLTFDTTSGTYPILIGALSTSEGSAGISERGSLTTILQPSSLPVTCTDLNPATGRQVVIQEGQDAQADSLFKDDLQSMWPALSQLVTGPRASWPAMVKAGNSKVNRVAVQMHTPAPGSVTLVIDPATEVANVFTWFNGSLSNQATNFFPPAGYDPATNLNNLGVHRPFCSHVYVKPPMYVDIVLGGTLYCAQAAITAGQNALAAYLKRYQGGVLFNAQIYYSLILATVQRLPGVDHIEGFALNGQVRDVQCSVGHLPNFDSSQLQWVSLADDD